MFLSDAIRSSFGNVFAYSSQKMSTLQTLLSAETDLTSPPPLALARCDNLQSLGYVVYKKRLGTLIMTGSAILWLLINWQLDHVPVAFHISALAHACRR
jgi:hypothetical protein